MLCRLVGARVFPPLESPGEQQPLRESLVTLSSQGPCEQKLSLVNCRFHTLAPDFLEGFSVRNISICAVNTAVPDDPQKELVVHRPELPVVSVKRSPRHAPVRQSLHGLHLQQPILEPQWGAWPVEELCGELSKASPSYFGAAVDISRDVGVFGNEAAQVYELVNLVALVSPSAASPSPVAASG